MTVEAPSAPTWPADLSSYCFEVPHSQDSILFERGEGIRLFDTAGRAYLDAMSGVFVTCFGYGCEPIRSAVAQQLDRMAFNPPLHGTNPNALALAEELTRLAPEGIVTAKLVNGGSEAVEAALRLARLYHRETGDAGRYKVLSYYHGYHGSTFGSLSVTGRPDVSRFGPGLPGAVHVWSPDAVTEFLGVPDEEAGRLAADLVERTIEAEGPDSVAAIIVEPVIHLRGMAIAPQGYLDRLREICDRHGVLLVFDEIVTGFGRTGQAFAAQTFGVTPDLMCVGKGVSGGYAPLAAVLVGERVASVLGDGSGAVSFAPSHTYAANPIASAAGLAAVRLFSRDGYPERIAALARRFEPALREAVGTRGTVRALGLLYGVKLADPADGAHGSVGERVARACLRRGVIVRGQDDWLVLAPAFVTGEQDTRIVCDTLAEALDETHGAR
ncbi:aminotransferase class III-fold pyridoxal phosphate-dependent enzyme [Streptomyces sp. PTM05]|uniref:Aminotransferase class III-fold pyridoxal phosphate-dependent enzyme n=1 Tax=Streptantibioticus parmotrematis TaxID=2873249 RepID=A0ABS7QR66_9ACTN|nr:aminotransferase class III-fold pyridoxal phosphate-dependent enzyme [Streptantibioticus parmotrematis]MBY8885241.1 aminotransferase class III-fold pyridoxal phosphate-dependent enzyme [Streptantibioticus parmotrematis]